MCTGNQSRPILLTFESSIVSLQKWEYRDFFLSCSVNGGNMRVLLAASILLSMAIVVRADDGKAEAEDADAIVWSKVFSSISAADKDEFVFVLITNDDPYLVREADANQLAAKLWCAPVLSRSVRNARLRRPDLRDRITVQALPVGMPANLSGGRPRNQPARAIVALCDGDYRLLAFSVGVPDTAGVLTLIEDAEEVQAIQRAEQQSGEKVVAAIAERSADRVSRLWRGGLEEMLAVLGVDKVDDDADVPGAIAQKQMGRLTLLAETYSPIYLADVKLRFALSEAADRDRLLVLEQHPEARRPWCEAMIPFLAGSDFLTLWSPLCESLWGFQPVRPDVQQKELLDWWDSQIKTDSVVLSLQPPLLARGDPWPPVIEGRSARRGLGWNDVQKLVVELPYRTVDAQQLAVLIESRNLGAVDIQMPTRARYLFFEPRKKSPLVVREGEPPGKFAGVLKRAIR